MKQNPRLRFRGGSWWCGVVCDYLPLYYLWATCAPTPKQAYDLWKRCQK